MSGPQPADYAWWLVSRASGIVALGLITVSVVLGLAMSAKLLRGRGLGRTLVRAHEQITLTGLVAIAVHGITLLGDSWSHPGITEIAVPFTISYRPFLTGLGIVGGYLAALLGLSFYVRRRIGARLWRKMHKLTLVVYLLAVAHTLGAGTDASTVWLRSALAVSGALILALVLVRVVGRRRVRSPRRRTVRSPQPATAGRESAA